MYRVGRFDTNGACWQTRTNYNGRRPGKCEQFKTNCKQHMTFLNNLINFIPNQMQMPPLVIDQQANRRGLAVSMLTRLKEAYSKIREDVCHFQHKIQIIFCTHSFKISIFRLVLKKRVGFCIWFRT